MSHANTGQYDNNDRLISVDGPWTNDNVAYQYDELGRMKALVPQGGQTVYYSYDDLGRLYGVQTGTNVYSYTYLDNSNLVQSLLRPNGSVTDYSYNDPLKRLTDVQNRKLNQQLINGYSYAYGNQDLISGETVTNGNPIPSFTAGLVTSSFDNVNRLMGTTNPDRTFAYDNDANMTRGYTPEGYVLNMQYDSENRIVSAEYTDSIGKIHKTEYAYSGDGLLARVKKYENGVLIKETRYVRAGFLPIQERDGTNAVKKEFTWGVHRGGGIGGLLNLRQAGSDYSYLYDGRGNVTSLLDNLQNVVATYGYDSYGTLMNKTGTIDQPFMFSTKQYDTETGLQYFGYRFYNPSVGRWITRDPLGELGGAAKAPAFFAGGLNLYQYVANDPINAIDPSGRQAFFWHFGITYGAARNSGLGVWDSMKHGWAVTREDRNATDRSASAANVHAMAGETASGQYQSREEALAAADLNMATGSLPSAIHTGQDYPGHNGESMENWGWNWSTAGHILNDLFPSLDTISQAYQNTQKIFSNRLRPCK